MNIGYQMMSNERICFKIFQWALVFINLQKKHLNLLRRIVLNKQGSMSLMPNYFCNLGYPRQTLDNQCACVTGIEADIA